MIPVLITGVGGPAGRALVEQLSAERFAHLDLVLIGTDMVEIDNPLLDTFLRVPAADHPEYLSWLRQIIGRVRARIVIPTVAEELVLVAPLRRALAANPLAEHSADVFHGSAHGVADWQEPVIVIGAADGVALAADKLQTMWALDAASVSVPRYASEAAFRSAREALDAFGGPIVLKPRVSRGGRGVQVVEAPGDVDWSTVAPGQIVQEFAPGTEYSPQVYRSASSGATTVVVLEKTVMKEGRVGNAAETVRLVQGEAPDIELLAANVVERLELTGPVDLDIRRTVDGVPVVLEVNARFGANSASAPELVELMLRDALGVTVP